MASRMDHLPLDHRLPSNLTAELADRLVEALADGDSVLLTGPTDPYPLFAAAARHPRLLRATVFQVGPPLDLISMLRQVTADAGLKDATLEQGFNSLMTPSAECERVVLFVAEAHLLPHATMRYIEFALHAGPHLTVVLAGQDGLLDMMALDGFAGLRNRIPVHLVLPDAGAAHTGLPPAAPVSSASNLALAYRMTPPRLLAAAVAAAGLAVVGIMSFSFSAPPARAVLAGPGAAPFAAAVEPTPEPANAQPAPVAVAGSVSAPDTSTAAAQQAPVAAPLPSPATGVEPILAAEAPAAAGAATVNVFDVPQTSVPASTPEVTDPTPGEPSPADAAGVVDAPAQPRTAQAGAPGPLPGSTPDSNPEVAEAPAASKLHPAMLSEPSAVIPGQVSIPDLKMVARAAAEPATRPDNAANRVALPPPTM